MSFVERLCVPLRREVPVCSSQKGGTCVFLSEGRFLCVCLLYKNFLSLHFIISIGWVSRIHGPWSSRYIPRRSILIWQEMWPLEFGCGCLCNVIRVATFLWSMWEILWMGERQRVWNMPGQYCLCRVSSLQLAHSSN